MKKFLILVLFYNGLSIAMQPPQHKYDDTATNALHALIAKDNFSRMEPEEIQKTIQGMRGLVTVGANPNFRPITFHTPLLFAIEYGDSALVSFLLKHGASPYGTNLHGVSPLYFASDKGKVDAAGLILDTGLDVEGKFLNNETRLTHAIRDNKNEENLIPLLLKRGANFKAKRRLQVGPPALPQITEVEVDPLGLAILLNKTNSAKLLIEAGANVNQVYSNDRTLLMWAAARENAEIVQSLMEHGAWKSLDKRNTQGKTALDIAHEKGFTEIEKLLKTPKML
ncbi:hypothetical protein BH09DEP1_BH09DEP1_8160 [soil metagenome]